VIVVALPAASAEILYEQHFNTAATHKEFLTTYPDLQIFNELEVFPGFSQLSAQVQHEVIDGALKFGAQPHPTFVNGLGWAELVTKEKFKPSAEGNKIRFTSRIKSKGNPGNYSVGITAWDLQFDIPPGFIFNDFLCGKHFSGVDLEECVGGVNVNLRERQRGRFAIFDGFPEQLREPLTLVPVAQDEWHDDR